MSSVRVEWYSAEVKKLLTQHRVSHVLPEDIDLNRFSELGDIGEELAVDEKAEEADDGEDANSSRKSDYLSCWSCGITCATLQEHHQHHKSGWHSQNVKLAALGRPTITEEQFDLLTEEEKSLEVDIVTLLDGHGSEEDEVLKPAEALRSSRLRFQFESFDQDLVLWRCLLFPRRTPAAEQTAQHAVHKLSELVDEAKQPWAVILCSGGNFAAGIFENGTCLEHKSSHRYTVRRKQGGLQAKKDGQSGTSAPKSAGSSLRRSQQKKLEEDIRTTMDGWAELLQKSSRVFCYTPGYNIGLVCYEGGPIDKSDPRIRAIPFPVPKCTFAEIRRVYASMSVGLLTPRLVATSEDSKRVDVAETAAFVASPLSRNVSEHSTASEALSDGHSLLEKIPQADVADFAAIPDLELKLDCCDMDLNTPLHIAAAEGRAKIVKLFLEHGADPTRRQHLDYWDYDEAAIPPLADAPKKKKKKKKPKPKQAETD